MSMPLTPDGQGSSTRPYLIRALHDWCTDNGFTPYLAVYVDHTVQVPVEYVKNNEIVLNASFEATSGLQLGNDVIRFKARFGGVAKAQMLSLGVQSKKLRENFQQLFSGLKIERFLEALARCCQVRRAVSAHR